MQFLTRSLSVVALGCLAFATPSTAQSPNELDDFSVYVWEETQRTRSVFELNEKLYQVQPADFEDDLVVTPSLQVSTEYDDNIFYADSDTEEPEEDILTRVIPGFKAQLRHEDYRVSAGVSAEFGLYEENDTQDFEDYEAKLDADIPLHEAFAARAALRKAKGHESRGAPNSEAGNSLGPTRYDVTRLQAGLYGRRKIGWDLDVAHLIWDYDNNGSVNNSDRDRKDTTGRFIVSYEIRPDYRLYAGVSLGQRDYDLRLDDNGFQRSSTGQRYMVGGRADITSLILADVFVGYGEQNYDDSRFGTVDTYIYGANVLWNVTRLTSIRARANRDIRDSILANISSYIETEYGVSVEHELRRSLLLSLGGGYLEYDFQGINGTDRLDDVYRMEASLRYFITRGISAGLAHKYESRDSDNVGQGYDKNVSRLSVTLAF